MNVRAGKLVNAVYDLLISLHFEELDQRLYYDIMGCKGGGFHELSNCFTRKDFEAVKINFA